MSEENQPGGFLGATTLAEGLRMRQLNQGGVDNGDSGLDQFVVREMNPNADAMGGPQDKNIGQTRRVQQPSITEGRESKENTESPEEKEAREKAEDFFRRKMFGDRDVKKKEDEPKPESAPDLPVSTEDKPDDKPVKKTTKVTKPRPGLSAADAETIATAAATAAVKAIQQPVTEADKKVASSDGPPELEDLDERDRHAYQVAVRMSEQNPEYKDLPNQMIDVGKRKKEYKEAWMAENKGQKFSWSDQDHADFLNQITPDFNTSDYDEARIDLRVKQVTREERERSEERIREIELRTMEGPLGEKAAEETEKSVGMLIESLAPEADWDLTTEAGRKEVFDNEPVLGEIAVAHSEYLSDVNKELVKIFDARDKSGRSMYRIDDNNPIHKWVRDTVSRWESVFAKSDPAKTTNDNGQTFVTRQQYLSLPESKRDDHWTILRDQTFYIVAKEIANQATLAKKKEVDKWKSVAERHKWNFDPDSIVNRVKGKTSRQQPRPQPVETPRKQKVKDDFSGAPSASTGGRIDTQTSKVTPGNEKFVDMMMSKLFPRSRE
jgi:hypothetical protein